MNRCGMARTCFVLTCVSKSLKIANLRRDHIVTYEEKIIGQIKKMLALSTDASTTEHERAMALNRAQNLMAKYSISLTEEKSISELVVQVEYKTNLQLSPYLQRIEILALTIAPIARHFGAYVSYNKALGNIFLFGFRVNCQVATHAIDTLLAQGLSDYRREYAKYRTTGFAITFWTGFGQGLDQRFAQLDAESSAALVVYDSVKVEFAKRTKVSRIKVATSNAKGILLGKESALTAQLRKGVEVGNAGKQLK